VDAAPGGVAQASYAGRPNVLGRINPVRFLPALLRALARLEDELNKPGDDPPFDHLPRVHGAPPRRVVTGSTTDARYYLNQFGVPAVACGPRSRNIHDTDEAVELASIVSGARVLARFMAGFFAAGAGEESVR
jgi:peptidase M20/M25/M40-like protein